MEFLTDQPSSESVVAITQTFQERFSLVVTCLYDFASLSFPTDRIYLGSKKFGYLS